MDEDTKKRIIDAIRSLQEEEEEEEDIEDQVETTSRGVAHARAEKYGKSSTEAEAVEVQEEHRVRKRHEEKPKTPPVALVIHPHCPLCQLLSHYQPFRALVVWFHVNDLPIVQPEELPTRYPDLWKACAHYSTYYEAVTSNPQTWLMRYINPIGFPPQLTVAIVTPSIATVEGPILFWNGNPPQDIAYIVNTPPIVATSPPVPRNIVDKSIYFKVAVEIMRIHQKVLDICLRHGWKLKRTQLYVKTEPIDLTGQQQVRLGRRRKSMPFPMF